MAEETDSSGGRSCYATRSVGDWVHSYSQGIWQVYRVLQGTYAISDRRKGARTVGDGIHVFSKRLLNKSWKRSFSVEVCDLSFTRPLEPEEAERLHRFIADNPTVMREFAEYRRPVNLAYNLGLNVPESTKVEFEAPFEPYLAEGMDCERIWKVISDSQVHRFLADRMLNATLQFESVDHEVRDGEFIFRKCRFLKS